MRTGLALAYAALVLMVVAARPVHAATHGESASPNADTVSFDRSLLSGGGRNTDALKRFERDQVVLPGMYNVDLYMNGVYTGRTDIVFKARPGHPDDVGPCITPSLLTQMRLQPRLSSAQRKRLHQAGACVRIGELVTAASAQFDLGQLRLDISIPQAAMSQLPRGYVAPENLTHGANALWLGYDLNSYQLRSQGYDRRSAYLSLRSGLNLGRWQFRNRSSLIWQGAAGAVRAQHRWQTIDSYVQREIPALGAQLTLGDTYTQGELFDNVGLRGVQLRTDPRMLPDSLRGYAPIVRGVARSNARVTIRQDGVVLYQTTVAPGPFEIKDLYPTGYGGNLEVEVREADGSMQRYAVPYASVQQLLRPGATRFTFSSGTLRNQALAQHPLITQGTLRHGFGNLFTGYTGVVGSRGYFAWLIGGAFNTRWGALALDVTSARTKLPGISSYFGRSYRLTYSKVLPVTDTALSVAAYRYSTAGYFGLNDAMLARDHSMRGLPVFATVPPLATNPATGSSVLPTTGGMPGLVSGTTSAYSGGIDLPRSRLSITLNQRLGLHAGSLFLNAYTSDYWNRSQRDTQFQLGYNTAFGRVSLNVTALRVRDAFGRRETQFYASINVPLGQSEHAPSLSASVSRGNQRTWREQMTVNGTAGRHNAFSYGVSTTHDNHASGTSAAFNGTWRSPYAIVQASAGRGSGYTQSSLGVSGTAVLYSGGFSLGQPVGDTFGIVIARHAQGASLGNAAGARIGANGTALVPYLTPYRYNIVSLDPTALPLDVQLDATSIRVAPRAGAVVLIPFRTTYGRSLIVQARLADGRPLPFGAEVSSTGGNALGVVGQGGQMLLRGVAEHGRATVHWTGSDQAEHRCSFQYTAPRAKAASGYIAIQAVCHALPTQRRSSS